MPPERSTPRTSLLLPPKEKKLKNNKNNNANSKQHYSPPLDELSAFKVLPVLLPCNALQNLTPPPPPPTHYLYFKKHDSKKQDPETPPNKTLFLLNPPVDATEEHVRRLFRHVGKIQSVKFHAPKKKGAPSSLLLLEEELDHDASDVDEEEEKEWAGISAAPTVVDTKPKTKKKETGLSKKSIALPRKILPSGAFAHVVFFEESAIPKAMNMTQRRRVWGEDLNVGEEKGSVQPLGYDGYLKQYHTRRPTLEELQSSVDAFMEQYAAKEKAAAEAVSAVHNVVDDDGFVLVTRKGRRNGNKDAEGTTVTAVRTEEIKRMAPKKKKELVNFYRFQMREAKKDKLAELRRKFEEDKEKIAALKSKRRFKPY